MRLLYYETRSLQGWFSEVYMGNPGPRQVVMANRRRRGKRKTKNSNRSQPPASTASKRPTWALALTAVACVSIAGFFWLRSLSGQQEELRRDEPPSGLTAEGANREGPQQAVRTPVAGRKSSSQPAAELSETPAVGLVSAGQRQYTEENLEQETMAVLSRLVKD
ncbi:MAG: hypothetical protein ISS70_22400, partial [Phycisphaerae bacterium]|nr:hypothetical protein [Phycisphaerae bacterium]